MATFILFVKRGNILFISVSMLECLDTSFLSLFWKTYTYFFSFLSVASFSTLNLFKIRLNIWREPSRCLLFVNQPNFLLASSSLKALCKLLSSFTDGFPCTYFKHLYLKVNLGQKVVLVLLLLSKLVVLFLTPNN